MSSEITNWLLASDEPWTRYRTLLDLLGRTEDAPEVQTARREMLAHPFVKSLIEEAATWPGYALNGTTMPSTHSITYRSWPILVSMPRTRAWIR